MKKMIISAYKPSMKATADDYIEKANAVKTALSDKLDEVRSDVEKIEKQLDSVLEALKEINLDYIYWYDEPGTELDSPEDFDWINDVPEDKLDDYFDVYEASQEIGSKLVDYLKRAEEVKKGLFEIM